MRLLLGLVFDVGGGVEVLDCGLRKGEGKGSGGLSGCGSALWYDLCCRVGWWVNGLAVGGPEDVS